MKKKVLIFPCGSEMGLEIYRSLAFEKNLMLYGGSSMESDPGKMYFENYFNQFPYVTEEYFFSFLNNFIEKYEIDIFYPAMDLVIKEVAKNIDKINCKVVLTNIETIDTCLSKRKTYQILKSVIKVPTEFSIENIDEFPVFIKPDFGYGSKGAIKVENVKELRGLNLDDKLILEYLPGKEYTVDCFTDNNNQLVFMKARERSRIVNGISASSQFVEKDEFKEIAYKINKKLNLTGAWFFQLKEDINGELTLLEVAPRIAGGSGLVRNLGINLPLLNIYNIENQQVSILENNFNIEFERSLVSKFKLNLNYNTVFIDLDDTIIINNSINSIAIKFIVECINRGCKIHLITRHKGNLDNYLNQFRITSLFDEIIWIKENERKSIYIKDNDSSIFIDDSFNERKEVFENTGIPVFSVDAIECLLN